jgi:hypothetical protein
MGFYVTRFVDVERPELAHNAAIDTVLSDDQLNGAVLNERDDPPRLFVDEVEPVSQLDVPDMPQGFVFFEEDMLSTQGGTSAPPPYLLMREDVACWVETRPVYEWNVTPQSLSNGCFQDVWLYDANGDLWPIVDAKLGQRLTFVNRIMPWRQLPVNITFGTSLKAEVEDVLIKLSRIFELQNVFSENLDGDPKAMLESLRCARTPLELIQIAKKTL